MAIVVYTTANCQRLTTMRAKKMPTEILRTITVATYVASLATARCDVVSFFSDNGMSKTRKVYLSEFVQLH